MEIILTILLMALKENYFYSLVGESEGKGYYFSCLAGCSKIILAISLVAVKGKYFDT